MRPWIHVVRVFKGGPIGGERLETNGSPPPFCEVTDLDNPNLVHTYVLSEWRKPEATYTWGGVKPA